MDPVYRHIEAILFCATEPVKLDELALGLGDYMGQVPEVSLLENGIRELKAKYQDESYSFEIVESGGGFQFLSKPAYQPVVAAMWKQKIRKRLSTSALETLSIIAYKQPITKPEIERIRGVNCDYAVQKLLEKELIQIAGKSDMPGRPVFYGTSPRFMDYFGINSLSQLPELREISAEENAVGHVAEE